jgi:hypothetical protein
MILECKYCQHRSLKNLMMVIVLFVLIMLITECDSMNESHTAPE